MIHIAKPEQIHAALTEMHEHANLSQRGLALTAGFRPRQGWAWEGGQRRPNLESLIRLADVCGYDVVLKPREDA
jgi:transcriptional regulator with XRE-family HTH domain